MPSGATIVQYDGKRGTVYRIKYRDADGRQIMETIGSSEKEAKRALRNRLADVDREGFRKPERVRFEEFASRWYSDYLPGRNLKPTTVTGYEITIRRHLIPFFGGYELAELESRPELIDRFVAAKMREGLSPKTIRNHLTDMGVMLKQAIRWKLIRTNPVAGAELPRVEEAEMQVLRSPASAARTSSSRGTPTRVRRRGGGWRGR